MRDFKLYQAVSVSDAVSVLDQNPGNSRIIAGGTDILSRNKNLITEHLPNIMVDITTIPNLNYIRRDTDGLRIGPLALISDVSANSSVASDFNILAQASDAAASPQIRNMATFIGDILQETWCWYLRYDYPCWRNGGNVCFGAIGDNRYYHSIFGGRLCYATHQSDVAPALASLDAQVTIVGPRGQRTATIDQLLPGITMIDGRVKADSLASNEMVTEVFVPNTFSGAKGHYEKVRIRPAWDFALAAAAVVKSTNDARITLGGVDVQPRRFRAGEDMLRGQTVTDSLATSIAEASVKDAAPLAMNGFRVDLLKTAVKRAVMAVA